MRDDINPSDNQLNGSVSAEDLNMTMIHSGPNVELEDQKGRIDYEGAQYVSSDDLDDLAEQLTEVEAKESVGLETEEASTVLRARLELAKARAALEGKPASPQRKSADQKLAASRVLQPAQKGNLLTNCLQYSSSICAVAGGVLLSSNTPASKFGFIFLACSSSQIIVSSSLLKQKGMMLYGASLFILVDCLGIYRWIVTGTP